MTWPAHIPLPDKRICDLGKRDLAVFRRWMALDPPREGESVPFPSPEEKKHRQGRERWKRKYAGKGAQQPRLLIRETQIRTLKANARRNATARRYLDGILSRADEVVDLPDGFFESFIPDHGPWNPGGNFCPNCVHRKSSEGLNNYFWNWDWRDPDTVTCPYCGIVYPDSQYPESGTLDLPRLGKHYTFHVLQAEQDSKDWRLGDEAGRFVKQPIHVSFTGNIRSMKIDWSISRLGDLSAAYAVTGRKSYVRTAERILLRFADVYPGYPLQSYFQDVVDADPGFAVDHADDLPTVFKRNACIGVYDGRFGYNHEKTTTRSTRVATGLWGASRIARELTTTGQAFLKSFQAWDLVKAAVAPATQTRIEQDFLLELYLDCRAYAPITNKAGPSRAARVAFGVVYDDEREIADGLEGFHRILKGQFHEDGSMKESPIYGHKPIGEDLWQIPEMLRGRQDLYAEGLYRAAFEGFASIVTPMGTHPPLDDSYISSSAPRRTYDIARECLQIVIPGPDGPPSDFAILNTKLGKTARRSSTSRSRNRYFVGRHLACLGYGSGRNRTQLYILGEDGLRGHRHAGALTLQLFTHGWEVFPDLGYICDHPGNQWVKATASHQTVTVGGANSYPAEPSKLLGFGKQGSSSYADMSAQLQSGTALRRAVTLIRKPDGWPLVVDLFEVSGKGPHDYQSRVTAPVGTLEVGNVRMRPRRKGLYQEHSHYPLTDFATGGRLQAPAVASWGRRGHKIRAHILTDASEIITYRSPGWRHQTEITAEPGKYLDTLVLRSRRQASRFIVVYDLFADSPAVKACTIADKGDAIEISAQETRKIGWTVDLPTDPAGGPRSTWRVTAAR